ncbi:MAG: hypothetical protein DRR42_19045 [Gammaproteobacteria bacterium]|nr:MAG: hypothetical protein DRR42_19045 [Gammaproteobacteria bacterium]
MSEFQSNESWHNSIPKPLEIRVSMPRDKARASLEECKMAFDVQPAYKEILEQVKQSMSITTFESMLFSERWEIEPTIDEPYHIITEQKAMPATLTSLKILSKEGEILFYKEF